MKDCDRTDCDRILLLGGNKPYNETSPDMNLQKAFQMADIVIRLTDENQTVLEKNRWGSIGLVVPGITTISAESVRDFLPRYTGSSKYIFERRILDATYFFHKATGVLPYKVTFKWDKINGKLLPYINDLILK